MIKETKNISNIASLNEKLKGNSKYFLLQLKPFKDNEL